MLLLIEDVGWNLFVAAVASSSKGSVKMWMPSSMRACCYLECAVTGFCSYFELLSSAMTFRCLWLAVQCWKWIFANFGAISWLVSRYLVFYNIYLVLVLLPHLFTMVLAAYRWRSDGFSLSAFLASISEVVMQLWSL